MKNFLNYLFATTFLFCLSCGSSSENNEQEESEEIEIQNRQATSLLGEPLVIPERSQEQTDRLLQNLEEAQANFDEEANEMNTIWLGRRYAYLSAYQEAIEVFTAGLIRFPESYKLYRHRGHRYISTREFDKAIADFEKAYQLMPKDQMETEPDGIPNSINQPLSNTQFNILYHYGLAHYLKGEFEKAETIYTELLENYCDNPDLVVATTDWLYMSLRRQNKVEAAASLLETIQPDMEIIENDSYFKRLRMYQGELPVEELFETDNDDVALSLATQGYGVGNWYLYNGDTAKAKEVFNQVLDGTSWAAFGYVASEADMARLEE